MLNAQVVVDLLLKFGVGVNLVRHGNFLSEGSSRKAVRSHTASYRWQLHCSYCACAGFLIATLGLLRNTSFGIDFIVKHEPHHHAAPLNRRTRVKSIHAVVEIASTLVAKTDLDAFRLQL
jgi:hypothetical protein